MARWLHELAEVNYNWNPGLSASRSGAGRWVIGVHRTGVEGEEEGLAGVPEGAGVPRTTQSSLPLLWPLRLHFLPRTAGAGTGAGAGALA